jgi:hypothetical protein
MELSLDYLSGRRASQGVLIKDSTALLDGARPSPKYFNAQYNNTFGGLANYLSGNTLKVQSTRWIHQSINRLC